MKRYFIAVLMTCVLAGCASPRVEIVEPVSDEKILTLVSQDKFYEAFLLLPEHYAEIVAILKNPRQDLGSCGDHAGDTLIEVTAIRGESQWDRILNESNIPDRFKVDLISEIISVHGANGKVTPALSTRLAAWEKLVELAIQELER